jgi:hypothetical protein
MEGRIPLTNQTNGWSKTRGENAAIPWDEAIETTLGEDYWRLLQKPPIYRSTDLTARLT